MKRLVAFGLVMAVATGAYAQFETMVYDFKANVKNTNVKIVQVRVPFTYAKGSSTMPVWVKYVENTMLYGYVVDGGPDWTWGVVANRNIKPAIGHLFHVAPLQIRIFDSTGKTFGSRALKTITQETMKVVFSAEGGIFMEQGEDWEGDNIILESGEPVNQNYLFGEYDTWGSTWLFGAGFGRLIFSQAPSAPPTFNLDLSGSIIGGWRDDECDVDMQICGWDVDHFFEDSTFHMSSWIAGTWSICRTAKIRPIEGCYVAGALNAINPNQGLEEDDIEDGDYP